MNRNLLFLLARVYTIKSSQEQNFKSSGHVDPVSSLSSRVTLLSGRVANSIRVPFFARPPARSPVLSRNSIRKAGGMHQLVKLRYLTYLHPPLSLGGRPAHLSVSHRLRYPSVLPRRACGTSARDEDPDVRVSLLPRWRRLESTWPRFARRPFLPLTPRYLPDLPSGWFRWKSLWYTYARSRTYFPSRVRRDTLSLSDVSLEKESFRRRSFASYYLRDISLRGGISLSSVFIILFQLAKLPRKFLPFFITSDSTLRPV